MNCKEFRKYLTTKTDILYPYKVYATGKDAHSRHWNKWIRHALSCQKCNDEYIKFSLKRRRLNIRRYSCVHIPYYLYDEDHYLMYSKSKNEVGIHVPDGGHSYIAMKYCPWCGKKIVIRK